MQIIQQDYEPSRTGFTQRVREASERHEFIVLRTAVEVYGYHNIRQQLKSSGFASFARRFGDTIRVYVNCRALVPVAERVKRPELRKALLALKPGKDCVVLTTPVEAHYFIIYRSSIKKKGHHYYTKCDGADVLVWKKA